MKCDRHNFTLLCVRHGKGFWLEVCLTKTYSLRENMHCDFGMQYTRYRNHYPNASFSTELLCQRTQRSKGFRDVILMIYKANSTFTAHKCIFGCMAGVVLL